MKEDKTFVITYTNLEGESVSINGKWTDKCKEWVSNSGVKLLTYFDLDADGYRTASKDWFIKWN